MDKEKELKEAVAELSDADIAELAGGRLSEKGKRIAKIAGITAGSVAGVVIAAAGITALVGKYKKGDAGYYFHTDNWKEDGTVPIKRLNGEVIQVHIGP